MALPRALGFAVLGWAAVICLDAQQTTKVNCDVPPAPLELSSFWDGYTGDIEWITDIPPNVNLRLIENIFPEHKDYVDLEHNPAFRNATVRTRKALDVEAIKSQFIWYSIVCQRIGTNDEIENARNVPVRDLNDNAPQFKQADYNASVSEVAEINLTVIKVEAEDNDFSPEFNILTYNLSGPDSDYFYIREGDGSIMVKKPLDYNKINLFNLTVQAKEQFGDQRDTASLIIHVQDYDTLNPYFSQPVYSVTINETQVGPLTILPEDILARDGDTGINEEIVYSIKLVNPPAYTNNFSINGSTGILEVRTTIDREMCPYLMVGIQAAQQDKAFKTADAVVLVTVEDVNDHRPVLSQSSYNVSILENFPDGMEVLQVTATDEDEGGFQGTFQLTPGDSPFQLSPAGILTVRNSTLLDRERTPSFHLQVTARDHLPPPYEAHAPINILLLDENDNSPTFRDTPYSQQIFLNMTAGMPILQVAADDPDDGVNGEISFILAGGNEDGHFELDPATGQISLKTVIPLEFDQSKKFVLWITATDGGAIPRSSSVPVEIFAVGNSRAQFTRKTYHVSVKERLVAPVEVAQMEYKSLSPDIPVEFQVLTESATFAINDTGVIYTKTELDYESQKNYTLTISLSDGEATDHATVFVKVLDVNDNPPEFSQAAYEVLVFENLQKGSPVYTFSVADKDEAGFSQGHFMHNSTSFTVDMPGILSLRNDTELDRETTSGFTLQVWAVDAEINGLSSSALFHITVLDVNDNNPEFQQQPYSFEIPEGDYSPGAPTAVGRVAATDLDEGENARITYYLSAEDGDNPYSIQQDGIVLVTGSVDRETKEKYELLLVASDNGAPRRQNFTHISIQVLDVNDNPPQFPKAQYSASVQVAAAKEGDFVLAVSATDLDAGNNSVISYSLLDPSDDFHLNALTGEITLSRSLDHTTADTVVTLTVVAADHGVPQLSSNASITLYLLVNDTSFGLTFESPSYEFSIAENQPPGTAVGSVKALTGSIAVQVEYSLKSHWDRFSVGAQGDIVALAALDREEVELFSVIVEALDSVVPPNTAVALVTVRVNDVNDNSPVFPTWIQTKLSAPENAAGLELGTFSATDLDTGLNALITYSLQDDFAGTFHIDSSTGRLMTTTSLDRETMDSYELKIVATDSGKPPGSASLALSLTVEDENDNPPVFPQPSYSVSVRENEPPHVILSAAATDADIGYNAIIHYTITGEAVPFHVGELSGNISTLEPLDYESRAQYTFTLKAFNPGDPNLQGTATITVTVEDVNEEGPMFEQPSYHQVLPDTSTAGTLVVDINARDENKGYDEGIFYNITGGNSEGLFSLSNTTGELRLTRDLSKQSEPQYYSLNVSATDSGLPPLSTSVKVAVAVAPSGVSLPVFSEPAYHPAPLSERTAPGTPVLLISVSHRAPVSYTIVSGDDHGYFLIDSTSGVIKTAKNFRLEDFPVTFHVRATDSSDAAIFNEVGVKVEVIDENDFPPVFPSSLLEETLAENLTATQIVQLKAQDNDTGRNGFLTYGILNGHGLKFRINETTGVLYSNATFDYEEEPTEYQVVVYAEDDGIPEKKRGYCTVVIRISDVNDWPPAFAPVPEFSVQENVPVGFTVGKITATDRDTGDNAFVLYRLTGGGENVFEIDETQGIIKIKNSPDYETMTKYNITVTAVNNKSAPFYQATTSVTVLVIDVNDNAPVFAQGSYSASINMINPVGAHVITVSATDRDQGHNGLVEYQILPDPNMSPFFLLEDLSEGKIVTTGNLSRSGEIHLTVMAKDKGSPPLNGTAVITLDVFDNRPFVPQFNRSEISISVLENTGVDYFIYAFTVAETSGKLIDYSVVSGNEKGHFRLDPSSGELKTAVNLNYEEVSQYVMVIKATSSAAEIRRSGLFAANVAMLTVSVQDVNEEPVFGSSSYSARIPSSVPYRHPVLTVQATDPDSGDNGVLLYSLVNHQTNEFDIDQKTGQIFTISVAGKAGTFYLQVQAEDQGTRRLTAQTTVNVTVDSSSSSNIVVVVLNQQINVVERNIVEVKRVLEDKLEWNVYVVDVSSDEFQRRARSSTDETHVKIIVFDEAHQEVPAEDVKRKLKEQRSPIEAELEKVFSTPVTAAVGEPTAAAAQPELIAAIVLGVILAVTLVAFLLYVLLDVRRRRKHRRQHLVKKQTESVEGIDNPWAADKNGSLKSLENAEHMKSGTTEVISFDSMYSTTGGDADKDVPEKGNYLETILLDYNSEHEEKVASGRAAELGNVEFQPTVAFITKQDSFLTDTTQKSAPPLTPHSPSPAPEKELKGVKFSEVAVILDAEHEDDGSEDDGSEDDGSEDEPGDDESGDDSSL